MHAKSHVKSHASSIVTAQFLGGLSVGLLIAIASGCSKSSTVDLQRPPTPQTEAPAQKPSQEGDNTGAPTTGDGTKNPTVPAKPTPAPVPVPARYRVFCESQDTGTIASSLTDARGVGGFFTLFIGTAAQVTRDNYNIRLGRRTMVVPGGANDHVAIFFAGRKEISPGNYGSERFYMSDVDVPMRTGHGVDLGSPPSVASGAASAAEALGLSAVNYGSSDKGTFVLLPGNGGLVVTNRDRTQTLGTLKVDASRTLFPKILEQDKIFTALVYDGSGFRPLIQKLDIAPTRVSVAKTVAVGGAGSASPVSHFDANSLGWSEGGGSSITIAKLDLATFKVERATYRVPVSGGAIFPQAGFVTANDETLIYVPVEKGASHTVDYAKLQMLKWGANATLADAGSVDYPQTAVDHVKAEGRKKRFILRSFLTSPQAEEAVATFDDKYGEELYKIRFDYLDLVIEDPCVHPTLVEETP